jgi:hypothetical protein
MTTTWKRVLIAVAVAAVLIAVAAAMLISEFR